MTPRQCYAILIRFLPGALLLGLIMALASAQVLAVEQDPQFPGPKPERFHTNPRASGSFNGWQVEEGVHQDTVTALVQSRDGYLWLGTYTGLVRFDGVRFTVFDSSNTRGLKNSRVTSLFEDSSGVLWIGHETGELTRMVAGEFESVSFASPGGAIEGITSDEMGDTWLLNDSGVLLRLRDGHSTEFPGGASPTRKAILTRSVDGELWLSANGVVATLQAGKLTPFQFDSTTWTDFYQAVAAAQDGGIWVMGNGRIRKWSGGRWAEDYGQCPCGQSSVGLLLETRAGALLAGTLNDGLFLVSPAAEVLQFTRTNGLSHDWVRALCEDHEGNIWIGTGGGLDALRSRKVKMFAAPDAFHGRAVLSFAVHSDGSAWIGTEGVGLYHRETNAWSIFGQSNGLANLFIWSVLETRRGELFVGTWGGGVLVKKGDRFESEGELGKITAPVVSLFEGQQGEVWIGTIAGLYRYEVGKITWSAGKERLVLPDVRAIAQTADGTIWFGMSGGGLGSINKEGVLKQFRKKDGLGSDFVISLHAGTDGTLWIGTSDNGICRLKQGKFTTISTEQGLPSRLISQIVDDGGGNLWMGSHRGILRASKADLNQCADRVLSKIKCLVYGKAEGLTSLICSGGFQPGACQTADRQLWFPTSKGLAIIDPANVTPNAAPPPVIIEDLRLDGESINLPAQSARYSSFAHSNSHSSPLRIPAGRHRFEFQYTALSFAAPDKVRFKYELEGLEKEWTDAGIKRVAQYSYLPPNDYHFRVKACNNDEVWNETGAELAFTVLPLYWQTWWFRALSIFAGAGMLGMGVVWLTRRRIHHRLDQVERQRAVERERARIARDIHDDLGASLTRITMLSQGVRSELAAEPQTAADVDQIYTIARELTRSLDEIVWAVNPKHDTLDSLVTYLGRFAQHFLSAAAIRCRLDVPLHLPAWALTAEIRHNVFLAFKEALHNVIKHARASEVRISMQMLPKGFVLLISDNGCGFDLRLLLDRKPLATDGIRLASGNGLINMQKRLDEVGGRCEWDTAPQEGTRVKLAIVVKT